MLAGATALALLAPGVALGFGGEDLVQGNPWHHEDITIRALLGPVWFPQVGRAPESACPNSAQSIAEGPDYKTATGFSVDAACAIAWHTDFLDAYLYNPLFWTSGEAQETEEERSRFEAALVGYNELVKLHFDDTFSVAGLRDTWRRYAAGTIVGLYWASQQGVRGDVAAAHHILGVSIHAVQDFYSHSNWVDEPGRRCETWLQTEPADRNALPLYAGSYELPPQSAQHAHGAYSLSCSILRGNTLDKFLDPVCTGLSPFQNTSVCEEWRLCRNADSVRVVLRGRQVPNTVRLEPVGIALDTTWLARVQATNRGLTDEPGATFRAGLEGMHFTDKQCKAIINADRPGTNRGDLCSLDADRVFAGAKDLAIRATIEWIAYLEQAMSGLGLGDFWNRVKTEGSAQRAREIQFEELSRLPYQFLTAGPYPVGNASVPNRAAAATADGWYLRVRVKTGVEQFADTDADIYAVVTLADGGVEPVRLDRLPVGDPGWRNSRLLVYDDFEQESDDVYTIGPFAAQPVSIALRNDAGSLRETLDGLISDVGNAASSFLDTSADVLLGLVAGHADYVGDARVTLTARELRERLGAAANRTLDDTVDIGDPTQDQGVYRFKYRLIELPGQLTAEERMKGWIAVEVRAFSLELVKEARLDLLSITDDPFVIFMASPVTGGPDAALIYLSDPLNRMDEGDTRAFPTRGNYRTFKLPPEGGLILAVRGLESDLETEEERASLRDDFSTGLTASERAPKARFLDEYARLVGADWFSTGIEVFGFNRSDNPIAGMLFRTNVVGEVDADTTGPAFPLNWGDARPLGGIPPIDGWTADPVGPEVLVGKWHAAGLGCDGAPEPQAIDVSVSGNNLTALKLVGDDCVAVGERLWGGAFSDATISGDLALGSGGGGNGGEPAMPPPNFRSPDLDKQIALEGNWRIEWRGSGKPSEPVRFGFNAPLYRCPNEEPECWRGLHRIGAGWYVSFRAIETPKDVTYGHFGAAMFNPDQSFRVAWYGWHMGGEGVSELKAIDPDTIIGKWRSFRSGGSYDGAETGEEIWRRVTGRVDAAILSIADAEVDFIRVGERPLRAKIENPGTEVTAREERPLMTVRVHGLDLWGIRYVWMDRASGIEVESLNYVCGPPGGGIQADFLQCDDPGNVDAIDLGLRVWPHAMPGRKTLFVDGNAIEIDLDTGARSRPIQLAVRACNLIEEIDPPAGGGLILRRSAARF